MLFKDEVYNVEELIEKVINYNGLQKIKIAVICFLFDENGYVLLNRRGPGARDEVGKIQAIGGSVNKSDENFYEALKREIKEETGLTDVDDFSFIGAYLNHLKDNETKEEIDWIILGYKAYIKSGKPINKENDRSSSFIICKLDDINESELSISTYEFIKELRGNV